MERMNEILARAASRRTSARRTPPPAQTSTPSATPASPASSASPASPASSGPRRAIPRRLPAQPAATGRPTPAASQPRTLADADARQPIQPAADVLDNDRILELPTRKPVSLTDNKPALIRSRPAERPAAMASIRELAPTYAAQFEPRRSGRAAVAAASSRSESQPEHEATPASPRGGTRTPPASRPAAQGGRAGRTTNKSTAPDVCPLCHGAGYVRLDVPVGDPAFGQAVRCQCKEQQIEERDRGNLRRLSNLDPFRDKTFETFDSKRPGIQEAYDVARGFAKDPMGWVIFRGGYGCGKTHLAAAIANAAEKNGIPVIFAIVPELLDHLRATFAPSSDIAYDALFDKVREVNLLVLDDFGAENGTAWATEKLFQLINYRYNYGMPTVITTNDRLLSHVDERIGSRLFDQGLARHVIIESKDYRRYRKTPMTRRPS